MKNSKLECVDERDEDHMKTDACVEDDECEEFDDFDPYFFMKNLPDLTSVVPTFRRMLLPKQTRSCPPTTLVLDLDGTNQRDSCSNCINSVFTDWDAIGYGTMDLQVDFMHTNILISTSRCWSIWPI